MTKKRTILKSDVFVGGYFDPCNFIRQGYGEFLVVECLVHHGIEYLTIAQAGKCNADDADEQTPSHLEIGNVLVATRLPFFETDKARSGAKTQNYLFNRNQISGLTLQGNFFPADGFATHQDQGFGMQLQAFGRHAFETDDMGNPIHPPRHALGKVEPGQGVFWAFNARPVDLGQAVETSMRNPENHHLIPQK